jgi:hypothetical protein
MFSKFARPDTAEPKLSLKEYMDNTVSLAKFKLPQLKQIAKEFRLHVTGTKPVLISRIQEYFNKSIYSIKIQKWVRGIFVRRSMKMRGDALKNRGVCVNDTDFYTMDPIAEIPHEQFYSYTDSKNFVYGFNLNSLMMLYKKKGSISNPYNREKMDLSKILRLYRLVGVVYPEYDYNEERVILDPKPATRIQNRVVIDASQNRVIVDASLNTVVMNATHNIAQVDAHAGTLNIPNPEPRFALAVINSVVQQYGLTPHISTIQNNIAKLTALRRKPLDLRIREVFMEIDQLGHYTDSAWFFNLDRRRLYIFYVELGNIWRYRAQLSPEAKYRICPYDPFLNVFPAIPTGLISLEQMRLGCLRIIESLIYMGVDADYRNLGAFHILTCLTIVSMSARNTMPWLYESIV